MPKACTAKQSSGSLRPDKIFFKLRTATRLERTLTDFRRSFALYREHLDQGGPAWGGQCRAVGEALETLRTLSPELAFDSKCRQVEALLRAANDEHTLISALLTLTDLHDYASEIIGWPAIAGVNYELKRLHCEARLKAQRYCHLIGVDGDRWAILHHGTDPKIRVLFEAWKKPQHDRVFETVTMADAANEVEMQTVYWSEEELEHHASSSHKSWEHLEEKIYQYEDEELAAATAAIGGLKDRLIKAGQYFQRETEADHRHWISRHKGYLEQHLLAAFHTAQIYFLHRRYRTARVLAQTLTADFDTVIADKGDVVHPRISTAKE